MPTQMRYRHRKYPVKKDTGRSAEGDPPVPLVGPIPEFEGGLVTREELRVLLGQDENDQ
jgi:hypothetical protein